MISNEGKLIQALIENRESELNISEIARLVKKDYKNTHNIVRRLQKKLVIRLERFGNAQKVILNDQMHPLIFEAEYGRREEFLEKKEIAVMYDSLMALSSKFYVLLVFGSYAKRTNTKHSDIDLMVIVPDKEQDRMESEIHRIVKTIPLKIQVNVVSESDFVAMKNSRQVTVGSEVIKKNILLHGVEVYYELIR